MSKRAWVTLATNDSYALGALVLAHSLRRVNTQHDALVLITPSVSQPMRERLAGVFAQVLQVDVLDSRDAAHLALLARPELGITFTKLHAWTLTDYDKCVFLDADTLVIQNCDELFEREELSAAPDVGWPDCFNSGVFVFVPSQQTFASLLQFAQERGSFDGGDQGLLNSFFSDWARGDINKHLPFLYNVTSAAFYSYLPALKQFADDVKIVHFIGENKPWLVAYDWNARRVASAALPHLHLLLQLWWDLFVDHVHPQLDANMAGVAGTLARLTLGAPEPAALDEHTRRQGWESGHIDYMGADSFQNIWAKISQTLQAKPEPSPASPPKLEPVETPTEAPAAPAPAPVPSAPADLEKLTKDASQVTPAPAKAVAPVPTPATPPQTPTGLAGPLEPAKIDAPVSPPVQLEKEAAPKAVDQQVKAPEVAPPVTPSTPKAPATQPAPSTPKSPEAAAAPALSTPKAPKAAAPPAPRTPKAPEAAAPPAPSTPTLTAQASPAQLSLGSATDSPPLANTPVKDSPVTAPAPQPDVKAAEEAKGASKVQSSARSPRDKLSCQLKPPSMQAAPAPLTPDSELEDAAALAQSIIASETGEAPPTPTVTAATPPALPSAPAPAPQPRQLAVDSSVPATPPAHSSISLAQIGIASQPDQTPAKPKDLTTKSKESTAAQIASSVPKEPAQGASKSELTTPKDAKSDTSDAKSAPDEPKKKSVKKVEKKEEGATDKPVPPPRKKEKKPKK